MRLYAVTPIHVDEVELTRRQRRYDRISPAGLSVELHDIGEDAPRALETPEDVRESERCVVAALKNVDGDYDGVFPDCVLDPAVPDLQGQLAAPVYGLLRLSLGYVVSTGRTAGAVTRNSAIGDELAARAELYGFSRSLQAVSVLDLDAEAIANDRQWSDAVSHAMDDLRGADVVLNGCSAVELASHSTYRIPVFDPTALALRILAAGEQT
jgi:allantoin racemase